MIFLMGMDDGQGIEQVPMVGPKKKGTKQELVADDDCQ